MGFWRPQFRNQRRIAVENVSKQFITFAEYVASAFGPVHLVVRGIKKDPYFTAETGAALDGAVLFARMRLKMLAPALGGDHLLEIEPGSLPGEVIPVASRACRDLEVSTCR
jgi:hypothetical protein